MTRKYELPQIVIHPRVYGVKGCLASVKGDNVGESVIMGKGMER